jgi:N-acetylglucosaminyl-diphospho-decaprenol L-rhamnosyltransferase
MLEAEAVSDSLPVGSPFGARAIEVLVVFTCYRSADLTVDCLKSLAPERESHPGLFVMICENGTGEASESYLRAAIETNQWDDWVSLRVARPNRGFAGGNNFVLEELASWNSPPKFILLLNTDTVVREGAIGELLKAAEQSPRAGVIGPRLEWPNGDPQISCFQYQSLVSEFIRGACTGPVTKLFKAWDVSIPLTEEVSHPEWLSFACALVRWKVIEEVGVLDGGYYLYFDDVDYCRRARKAGWEVVNWPRAHVVHLRGRSNPVKSLQAALKPRPRYYYASRTRYFRKFYGIFGHVLANIAWTAGRGIALFREVFGKKGRTSCERESRDIWTQTFSPRRMPELEDISIESVT